MYTTKPDYIIQIENQPEIQQTAKVLKLLEDRGLKEPVISGGWIRSWLINEPRTDIDVSYVGKVHYETAQAHLKEILESLHIEDLNWDVKGIWNAQIAMPEITSSTQNLFAFYINSIDSVYLAPDGQLYDLTKYGFEDAQNKILRMNDFYNLGFQLPAHTIAYLCLEGCRRITKFGWIPTPSSIEIIHSGLNYWNQIAEEEKNKLRRRLIKKYSLNEFDNARHIYNEYGWGFIFDEAVNLVNTQYK